MENQTNARALIVVTSHSTLGTTGKPTGYHFYSNRNSMIGVHGIQKLDYGRSMSWLMGAW